MGRHIVVEPETVNCLQEDRIGAAERDVKTLNKIVIVGNGAPSLVSQMAVMRQTVFALCWLVGVTCVAVIGQFVVVIFRGMLKG